LPPATVVAAAAAATITTTTGIHRTVFQNGPNLHEQQWYKITAMRKQDKAASAPTVDSCPSYPNHCS